MIHWGIAVLEKRNLRTYRPYQENGPAAAFRVLSLCQGLIDPEFLYQITASQAIKFRSTDSPLSEIPNINGRLARPLACPTASFSEAAFS